MEALREAVIERRSMSRFRWIAGVLSLVGGVLFGAATASAHADSLVNLALYCAFALILGLALLAPALIPPIVRLVTWPVHSSRGAIGVLVRESATSAVRRTASTAAPVLVTVSFAALISVTAQTSSHAYHTQDAARVPASRVLVPDGTPGLSDAAVATVPGISLLISTAYASGNTPIGAVGVPAGTVPGLDGGTVAAADWALSQYGWRVGGVVPITFADGTTVPMRVVSRLITAIPGGIALDRKTLRAHDPSALTDAVYAAGSAGPPPGAVGARLVDVTTYAGRLDAQDDRLIWLFVLLLVGVSVGYTAIAIANTLLMATAHRAGDFRALHRIGATRRQISWAVAGESTLVVGIGTLLAGVVSSVALAAVRSGLAESTGVPISLVVPWPTLLAVTAACLLLAQLASVVPARIALSRRISPVS
jgi:putative ABC transport system permease protein